MVEGTPRPDPSHLETRVYGGRGLSRDGPSGTGSLWSLVDEGSEVERAPGQGRRTDQRTGPGLRQGRSTRGGR